ncbi:hypothetical protein [Metapseudomonas otitidis]|uniref:hypothetical protein n=1 Tax=Metapseudomonas otitidis TaxID=319939 RepID=UPI0013F60A8F|nr:hypothetical protein [Pseudomonas otitidis]
MSPEGFIVLLVLGWLLVAVAMLWGMLRLTHHHHPTTRAPRQAAQPRKPGKPGKRRQLLH